MFIAISIMKSSPLRKRVFQIIVSFFVIYNLISCGDDKNKSLFYKLKVKQIVLPNQDLLRNLSQDELNPLLKEVKVLTVINGDCYTCIEELNFWKKFMKDINTNEVGFIYLIHSKDKLKSFKIIDSLEIQFDYPYFEDIDKVIFKKNNFSENKIYQTFLLDKNNKVILVGNPMFHSEINDLYIRELNRLQNDIFQSK